ncbi:MAG: tetratricopeptide repeat protein, partial [Bacteroidota bacterium]
RKSLDYYLQALSELENSEIVDLNQERQTQNFIGFSYGELGLDDKAMVHYQRSLDLAVQLRDTVEIATAHYNLSSALLRLGRPEEAMKHLSTAYEIDKARKDTSAIGFDLNSLGYVNLEMGNTAEAIKYYRESISLLAKSSGNFNSLGARYNNLANAFSQAHHYDSALHYNSLSIEVHEGFNDSINLAERWVNRAKILISMNELEEAIAWTVKAKAVLRTYEKGRPIMSANVVLIECMEMMKQYDQALELCEENIALSKSLNLVIYLKNTLLQQAKIYEKQGETGKAYDVYKEAMVLNDSIQSAESRRLTEELEIRYEVDKVESENELLRLEKELAGVELEKRSISQQWLLALLVVITIGLLIIIRIVLSRSNVKRKLLESEINQLRLQIKGIVEGSADAMGITIEHVNSSIEDPLSEREFEVLSLALTDVSNTEIAEKTFVSVNTVKYHLKNIYGKLGVSNRKEAMQFALRSTKAES